VSKEEGYQVNIRNLMIAGTLLLGLAQEALADNTFILVTGRRDPRIYAIDLQKALQPANNNTPNAIVSRSKVDLRERREHGVSSPMLRVGARSTRDVELLRSAICSSNVADRPVAVHRFCAMLTFAGGEAAVHFRRASAPDLSRRAESLSCAPLPPARYASSSPS
jgi:hypothetical protein